MDQSPQNIDAIHYRELARVVNVAGAGGQQSFPGNTVRETFFVICDATFFITINGCTFDSSGFDIQAGHTVNLPFTKYGELMQYPITILPNGAATMLIVGETYRGGFTP